MAVESAAPDVERASQAFDAASVARQRTPPDFLQRVSSGFDWPLAAILLVAFAVRAWGADWLLPYLVHGDEEFYVRGAAKMLKTGDLNPHNFHNPSLAVYWLAGELWLLGVVGTLLGSLPQPTAVAQNLDAPLLFVVSRLNAALLGTASVWATYRLGILTLERGAALVAAAFLAVNLLHVRDSHYATNDIPATFPLLLSTLFAVQVSRRPATRLYLLAGLCGGLAAGTKYSAGMFVVVILAAHALAWQRRALSPVAIARLLAAGLVAALAYLASTPFTVLDWPTFVADLQDQAAINAQVWPSQSTDPVPLLYLLTVVQAMGIAQALLLAVGLGVLAARDRRAALLLAAFPLGFLAYMAPQSIFFARLTIPLLPFFALLAAAGLCALVARLSHSRRHAAALPLLAGLALVQPGLSVFQHNQVITREGTQTIASRWVVENLSGSRLGTDKLAIGPKGWDWPSDGPSVKNLNQVHRYTEAYFRKNDYDYLVTSSRVQDIYESPTNGLWLDLPEAERLERRREYDLERERAARFAASHTPIAVFAPGVGNTSIPYRLDDNTTPFWNLGAWERLGPTIKIYAVPAGDDEDADEDEDP
jgi:4-amino-4-deoxy-L-arabinose transferase-like glycosyltransferase